MFWSQVTNFFIELKFKHCCLQIFSNARHKKPCLLFKLSNFEIFPWKLALLWLYGWLQSRKNCNFPFYDLIPKFLSCIFSELHLTYVWVKRRWSLKISHRQTEPSVELVVSNYFQIESSSLILLQKWVCIPPLYEKQFLKLINIHNARQDIQKYCTENHLQTKQYDKKQDFS